MSLLAFDVDGTLITCRQRQLEVLRVALSALKIKRKIDLTEHWNHKQNGLSTRKALIEQGLSSPLSEAVGNVWERYIEEPSFLALDRIQPGVSEQLANLHMRCSGLIIISARKNASLLRHQLTYLGLMKYFRKVLVVSPRSSILEKGEILKELTPDLFVGDTETDAQAARMANIHFCAVTTGQRNADFLKTSMIQAGSFPLVDMDCCDLMSYL
ncbi:MAG: HAD family hydrolase [Leptospirales bacterium]